MIAAYSMVVPPAFGRSLQCIVFNCSDQIDHTMPARLLSGLVQTGAWTCLDEFNRINIEVLSVIAEQVGRIPVDRRCPSIGGVDFVHGLSARIHLSGICLLVLRDNLRYPNAFFLVWDPATRTTHFEEHHPCVCRTADGAEERPLGGRDKGHIRGTRTPSQGPSCGGDDEPRILRPDRAS